MDRCDFVSLDPWSYDALVREGVDRLVGEAERQPLPITFKIRHTPEFARGTLYYDPKEGYHIDSEEDIQGIAPGQYAVLYDENDHICFGSGMITKGW